MYFLAFTQYRPLMRLIILLLIFNVSEGAGLFDWVWGGTSESGRNQPVDLGGRIPMVSVPFEVKAEDEKFLQEAVKYTGVKLSELDTCQHRVVMKIRGSCSSMTEEDLAKMSVNLLNCQSSVEGRQMFPCTDSMSIRECTSPMDADTWNAYHLMNNRARAVCYAARHQQFRALSEMTVNKLMTSAHDQLAAMAILKEGQHKLESMTSNTLETVEEGHKALAQQQERLRSTQQSLQDFVSLNLRYLTREKALIAAGHEELAKMTLDVRSKLEEASRQLSSQAAQRQDNHQELVRDLDNIQRHAQVIWKQIEQSTDEILAQHASAAAQHEETLNKLARINATVNFLLSLVDQTRLELDIRLAWITSFVSGTGDKLEKVYCCVQHGLYLLLGMISASFLQAPGLTRVCLMAVTILNLVVAYNQGPDAALDFSAMTFIILASTGVNWLLHFLIAAVSAVPNLTLYRLQGSATEKPSSAFTRASEMLQLVLLRFRCQLNSAGQMFRGQTETEVELPRKVDTWVPSRTNSIRRVVREDSSDSEDELIGKPLASAMMYKSPPTPSRTPSRSGTPGGERRLCSAVCLSGLPCKNNAVNSSDFCRRHVLDLSHQ